VIVFYDISMVPPGFCFLFWLLFWLLFPMMVAGPRLLPYQEEEEEEEEEEAEEEEERGLVKDLIVLAS